jgi:hypothetical protein
MKKIILNFEFKKDFYDDGPFKTYTGTQYVTDDIFQLLLLTETIDPGDYESVSDLLWDIQEEILGSIISDRYGFDEYVITPDIDFDNNSTTFRIEVI